MNKLFDCFGAELKEGDIVDDLEKVDSIDQRSWRFHKVFCNNGDLEIRDLNAHNVYMHSNRIKRLGHWTNDEVQAYLIAAGEYRSIEDLIADSEED